jgi:hypothetical protein
MKTFLKNLDAKKKEMQRTECKKDLLESHGFGEISDKTFDGIFMKGWQIDVDESSEEELEPAVIDPQPEAQPQPGYGSDQDIEEQKQHLEELQKEQFVVEKPEPLLLDLTQVDPTKVNWFKYIVDKYLNEESDSSALNSTDAYANLLQIVLSNKKDEEIQNELLDLVGFENFELLSQLIEKRTFIKEYC